MLGLRIHLVSRLASHPSHKVSNATSYLSYFWPAKIYLLWFFNICKENYYFLWKTLASKSIFIMCVNPQAWKVLKSVWQMTMLMDRCAETLPKESIFSIISNSKVFSSTTPFLEQLQHPSCNKIFTQSLVWQFLSLLDHQPIDGDDDDDSKDDKWGYKWSQ